MKVRCEIYLIDLVNLNFFLKQIRPMICFAENQTKYFAYSSASRVTLVKYARSSMIFNAEFRNTEHTRNSRPTVSEKI